MLNFLVSPTGLVMDISSEYQAGREWINRNDFHAFEFAATLAAMCNARAIGAGTTDRYMATDAGEHTSPRYDVIRVPQVGAAVSRHFNGDSYPAGTIAKISKSLRVITTTDGTTFYRRARTAAWVNAGTWAMISGHRNDRNPSF